MIVEKEGYLCGGIPRKEATYVFEVPLGDVAELWVWAGGRLFNVHPPFRRRNGVYGIRWEERPGPHKASLVPVLNEL